MLKFMALMLLLFGALVVSGRAAAQTATVQCESQNYQYNECYAPMRMPVMVQQISKSACIANRTWGFNPATLRIWVSDGCAGVFADDAAYYGGQGSPYYPQQPPAYGYPPPYSPPPGNDHARVAGAVVAGAVLGALIEASSHDHNRHSRPQPSHNGCHGAGCRSDNHDQSHDHRH